MSETKKLLAEGMTQRPPAELTKLLAHPDQRIRQKAQFALAERGDIAAFVQVAAKSESELARLHAIFWGSARSHGRNLPRPQ